MTRYTSLVQSPKTTHRMSRELRLSYLCNLLYQRIVAGDDSRTTWTRRYKLIVELDREITYNTLSSLKQDAA